MSSLNLNLCEPYYSLIYNGIKTAEGRVKKGRFAHLKRGDFIMFSDPGSDRSYLVVVTYIEEYPSFYEMMKQRMNVLLPNIINTNLSDEENWNNGVAVYKKFFTDEQEQLGVLCIGVKVISPQILSPRTIK